jgi:hypothetical protein
MKLLIAFLALCLLSNSTLAQNAPGTWDVLTAGAKPDGVTDNTPIFQKLLDEAGKAGGGIVTVPAGSFRIAGNLSIPANVTLQGTYRVPPALKPVATAPLGGSILQAMAGRGAAEGPPFINLAGTNAAIAGFIITYPEWRQTDVPPVPYPPCIASQGTENVGISECMLLNPYQGLRFELAHRPMVRNVTGYPSWRGLYVTECMDIGHIENIHFWPFGVTYDPHDPYCRWVNQNGTAFEIAHTDWLYMLNTFCFGYGTGYKFTATDKGSANGNFIGLGADSCQRAVLVEHAQAPGLLITNGEFVGRWGSTDAVGLEVGPNVKGKVSLVNCAFWGPLDRCVWMRGAEGQFTASACNFVNWDIAYQDSPAIQIDAGKVIVQGSTFCEDHLHVRIGKDTSSAILTANQAAGGFRMDNQAGKRTQSAHNENDNVEWTPEARSHYRISMGEAGSGRYLGGWHGAEVGARWSMPTASMQLPMNPGNVYSVAIKLMALPRFLAADSGLYLDGKAIALFTNSDTLTAILPATEKDYVRLELRSQGWVPMKLDANSNDPRTLGVQVSSVEMRAMDADEKCFDANTGNWLEKEAK